MLASFIIPTHNRPSELLRTLAILGSLPLSPEEFEVIVVDNASTLPAICDPELTNGVRVRSQVMTKNIAAAARNHGALIANGQWLIMLDDDSSPIDAGFIAALKAAAPDVAAVAAEIFLPGPNMPNWRVATPEQLRSGPREAGGLPEVFIGCGVAIRREVFQALGGYDQTFDYYAEEYDLSARMLAAGHRVVVDRRFCVLHRKVPGGRSMGRILARLVRNNAWVMRRYAPAPLVRGAVMHTITRYAGIARKERALPGFVLGAAGLALSLPRQKRSPLPEALWDRFTGLAAARAALGRAHAQSPLGRVALVAPGKNAAEVARALRELNVQIIGEPDQADALVVATLSPGPMLDAMERLRSQLPDRRVITPWDVPAPTTGLVLAA